MLLKLSQFSPFAPPPTPHPLSQAIPTPLFTSVGHACKFFWTSLMSNNVQHLFICLFAILFLLMKFLFISLSYLKKFSLLLNFESFFICPIYKYSPDMTCKYFLSIWVCLFVFSFLLLTMSFVQQKFCCCCCCFNFNEVPVYQLIPLWIMLLVLYLSIFSCFLPKVLGFLHNSLQIDIHLFWHLCQGDQLYAPEWSLHSCGKSVVSRSTGLRLDSVPFHGLLCLYGNTTAF